MFGRTDVNRARSAGSTRCGSGVVPSQTPWKRETSPMGLGSSRCSKGARPKLPNTEEGPGRLGNGGRHRRGDQTKAVRSAPCDELGRQISIRQRGTVAGLPCHRCHQLTSDRGGARTRSPPSRPVEGTVLLELASVSGADPVQLRGEVRHVAQMTGGGLHVGIRFIALSARAEQLLDLLFALRAAY